MMKSEQDTTALLEASVERQKIITSKALLIIFSAVFSFGFGAGLVVYHFFFNN